MSQPLSSQTQASEASRLKTYRQKRATIKGKLTRFSQYIETLQVTEHNVEEASYRISQEQSLLKEFEELQGKIEFCDVDQEVEEDERIAFEDKYYLTIGAGKRKVRDYENELRASIQQSIFAEQTQLNQTAHVPTAAQQIHTSRAQLPKINLPHFDGKHSEWLPFKELFTSLVHSNETLDSVQKFHYLRIALKGSANKLIDTLPLNAQGYETAWNLLNERFQNTKVILQQLLQSLIEYTKLPRESATHLIDLLDHFNRQVRSIEAITTAQLRWDHVLTHLLASKLDANTLKAWNLQGTPNQLNTFQQLCTFIQNRGQALESQPSVPCDTSRPKTTFSKPTFQSNKPSYQRINSPRTFIANANSNCALCDQEHPIYTCEAFHKQTTQQRWNTVNSSKLCSNCLGYNHTYQNCRRFSSCKKCQQRHHTLLHRENSHSQEQRHQPRHQNYSQNGNQSNRRPQFNENRQQASSSNTNNNSSGTVLANNAQANRNTHTFLATAEILVRAHNGKTHRARALLDSGATHTFITKDLANRINLQTKPTQIAVTGVNLHTSNVLQVASIEIQDSHNIGYKRLLQCLILDQIAKDIPSAPIDTSNLKIPRDIQLADPRFHLPGHIDILLGADVFWNLLTGHSITINRTHKHRAYLRETRLGWILSGQIDYQTSRRQPPRCHLSITEQIHKNIEKFWTTEEINTPIRKQEDEICEKHYQDTVSREDNGQYTVSLPFKQSPGILGASRAGALRRFYANESRLHKQPVILRQYTDFMQQYEQLGHMTQVTEQLYLDGPDAYYIPHQFVTKEDSATTKLRVVFNASYKTSTGNSLNDILYQGPCVQPDLYTTLLKFRCHPYVISADIEKMYRMVKIKPEDRSFQRIFWRENKSQPIRVYELNTVTYGQAHSAFSATRTLNQLAEDEKHKFPTAASILLTNFYVDDALASFPTEKEAIHAVKELPQLLKAGGFNLTQFCTNSDRILKHIPADKLSTANLTHLEEQDTVKTLGLYWNPKQDVLQYTVKKLPQAITKRQILSAICTLYDPQGLISPIITAAKCIMQQIWLHNIGWDQEAPIEVQQAWNRLYSQLHQLEEYRIPRNTLVHNHKYIELHFFSDASPKAYGTACYLKSTDNSNHSHVQLLTSKSKVAPLKPVTLPKLELCAAQLSACLYDKIKLALQINIHKVYFWSDSYIVLHWISQLASKWTVYVAHRVAKIQESTENCNWRYVPSADNPADLITKPIDAHRLQSCNLWWHGPQFLTEEESYWPTTVDTFSHLEAPETKQTAKIFTAIPVYNDYLHKYSSFKKLNRITALLLRFKHNCLHKKDKLTGPITLVELQKAHDVIIKCTQLEVFKEDIQSLKKSKKVQKTSTLLTLHPFLDNNDILRVGGRLHHSDLDYDAKHPMILPTKHHITTIIIRDTHLRHLHEGPQGILYSIRQRYWPIRGVQTVKAALKGCLTCFRHNPVSKNQIMGTLPKPRVIANRAFDTTAIDFVGPINIKEQGRGKQVHKAYISMHICMCTKAVHIELVTALTSAAFIASLERFVARRGLPSHLYLDNGRNFVGASKEIQEFHDQFQAEHVKTEILNYTAQRSIQFHFLPPRASHMAGLVERSNRSMKTILFKVIKDTIYTYEEIYTLLCKIEAILNSRPLTPFSNDSEDFLALTPGHFIIGSPLNRIPQPNLQSIPLPQLSRYQLLEAQAQTIWSRWLTEYLNTLQQSQKWHEKLDNLKHNQLVILKVDNTPPMLWPLARVIEIHPGPDNVVRVVTVRTPTSILKRSIDKLCPVPHEDDSNSFVEAPRM